MKVAAIQQPQFSFFHFASCCYKHCFELSLFLEAHAFSPLRE